MRLADGGQPVTRGLKMLYACSALIMLRSILRIVEYIMGVDSFLLPHEWSMFIYDAVPTSAVQAISLIWSPDGLRRRRAEEDGDWHALIASESQGPIRFS